MPKSGLGPSTRQQSVRAVSPEEFGARGDGVTDDTAAVQRALNTLELVRGKPGAVYLCSKVAGQTYALQLRSGMRWEGNGSIVKLAPAQQNCSLLRTELTNTAGTAVSTGIVIRGKFDGNQQRQGAVIPSGTYYCPTIHADRIAGCEFDLEIANFFIAGFHSSGDYATNLGNSLRTSITGGRGSGINIVGTRWDVPFVSVMGAQHVDAHAIGNAAVFDVRDSTIGDVFASNCGWGVKFQHSMARTRIGTVTNIAGPLSLSDFAVKFQGDVSAGYNQDVSCGSVICEGHNATGLYLYANRNLVIGSYSGMGNGADAKLGINLNNAADIQIIDSEVRIDTVRSENAAGVPVVTLGETPSVHLGELVVVNPAPATMVVYARGNPTDGKSRVRIDRLSVTGTRRGWNAPLVAVENRSDVYVGEVRTDARRSGYGTESHPVAISYAPATASIHLGPISWPDP